MPRNVVQPKRGVARRDEPICQDLRNRKVVAADHFATQAAMPISYVVIKRKTTRRMKLCVDAGLHSC
jgi:hypothetical protein